MVEPPAPLGGPRSAWTWVVAIRTFFSRRRPGWSGGGALDVEVALPAVPVVPDVQRGRVRECPDGAPRDVAAGGVHPQGGAAVPGAAAGAGEGGPPADPAAAPRGVAVGRVPPQGEAPVPGVPVVEIEGLLVVGDGRGDAAGQAHPCDVAGVVVEDLPAGEDPQLLVGEAGGAQRCRGLLGLDLAGEDGDQEPLRVEDERTVGEVRVPVGRAHRPDDVGVTHGGRSAGCRRGHPRRGWPRRRAWWWSCCWRRRTGP